MKKLSKAFYLENVVTVARNLIGCFLVRECEDGKIIGRINEVEAYDGKIDKACHAYGHKRTKRNEPLFHRGGIAHVYFIYGMYNCLNIVAGQEGDPSAVLIRGVEIVQGLDIAACNRYSKAVEQLTKQQLKNMSNGPGKLCRALSIDRSFDFASLQGDQLFICEQIGKHEKTINEIEASKRIGIDYAEEARDFLWRFTG